MKRALFFVFLFYTPHLKAAECVVSILPLGTSVSGELTSSDCTVNAVLNDGDSSLVDVYQFTLSNSSSVVASMTSDSIDSFLRLTNSNFTILETDDDSGIGFNSQITMDLDAGTYSLLANSATTSVESGQYFVSVNGSSGSDFDRDGIPDSSDSDDDNDGVADTSDAFPFDSSESKDSDGDGVGDNADSESPLKLGAGQTIELSVVDLSLRSPQGNALLVPVDATAVALNITAVKPSGGGHITVWPCGVPMPTTSTLNYVAGQVVANGVIAPIGLNGKVCFSAFRETDLIVDIGGWFVGDGFVGATPKRLIDSRFGTGTASVASIAPDTSLRIQVTNVDIETADGVTTKVPTVVEAVALNVTAVKPSAGGHITVYPCEVAQPEASNLNYIAGAVVANGVIAPVGADGEVCLSVFRATDVIVDLAGWFVDGFVGAVPERLVDSRTGQGGKVGRLAAAEVLEVPVRGATLSVSGLPQLVPDTATAVALNVTVVRPVGNGHVTVWPCSAAMPNASNLNYSSGSIIANNVIAPIGEFGKVCLSSFSDTDVIVDVSGWFESDSFTGFVGNIPQRLVDTRVSVGPAPK